MKKIYLVLLLIILNIIFITAKKKKKVDKKPASIEQELFCNSCQAIVQETLKIIHQSKKESDVISALEGLCDMKHFYVYEYPPPEMRKGCEAFYDAYQDVLERELIKRIDNESIQDRICNKVTKVCVGVDFEAKKQESIRKQKEENARKQQGCQIIKIILKEEEKQKKKLEKKKEEQQQQEKDQKEKQEQDDKIEQIDLDKQEEL